MSFFARLFPAHVEPAAGIAERLQAWRALPRRNERVDFHLARLVVVDVETTGLNPRHDRLLSIGAVAVEGGRVRPAEAYDVTVNNPIAGSHDNILVHGISPDAQIGGIATDEALMGFLEMARHDVLAAFHAGFDQAALTRTLRAQLGMRLANQWLDVAVLAPQLVPEARLRDSGLDDWLAYFGLCAHARHRAAFEALATVELLLILLARAKRAGLTGLVQLPAAAECRPRFSL